MNIWRWLLSLPERLGYGVRQSDEAEVTEKSQEQPPEQVSLEVLARQILEKSSVVRSLVWQAVGTEVVFGRESEQFEEAYGELNRRLEGNSTIQRLAGERIPALAATMLHTHRCNRKALTRFVQMADENAIAQMFWGDAEAHTIILSIVPEMVTEGTQSQELFEKVGILMVHIAAEYDLDRQQDVAAVAALLTRNKAKLIPEGIWDMFAEYRNRPRIEGEGPDHGDDSPDIIIGGGGGRGR